MKRTGLAVALALGMMTHGVMAKTLNVVTSFSIWETSRSRLAAIV